ncbi:MAG: FkbM family methyltransferase [Acidimicrobiales bacterium]
MDRMISYAQQGEDVVLWRALRHRQPGFFVDVGAHHPVGSSVTKVFSNAGWRGINIEPIATMIPLFDEDRPRDVNLAVGISNTAGTMTFFDVVDDQQRSTFSSDLAAMYRNDGYRIVEHEIPVVPLSQVWAEHVDGEVAFLKIDAEGHEEAVLSSLDLKVQRPHIVLAEGAITTATPWLKILDDAGYRPALFDGLNHFYVAAEQWDELGQAMSYPACSLDAFVTYDHLLEVNSLRDERDRARAERDAAVAERDALRARLDANPPVAEPVRRSRLRWPR